MNNLLPPRPLFSRQYPQTGRYLGSEIELKKDARGTISSLMIQNTTVERDFQKLFSDNFESYSAEVEAGLANGKYALVNPDFLNTIKSVSNGSNTLGRVVEQLTRRVLSGDEFYVDLITTIYTESVHVVAMNNLGGRDIDLHFRKNRDDTVWVSTLENKIDVTLPIGFTESDLIFSMVTLWLMKMQFAKTAMSVRVNSKISPKENDLRKKAGELEQGISSCSPKDGVHRVSHDLLCTIPYELAALLGGVSIAIPLDGKFGVWVPTLGVEMVDVLECCRSHDIALWCSHTRSSTSERSARSADFDVVGCILSKLYDAFTRGDFFEDFINVPYFVGVYGWVLAIAAIGSQVSNIWHSEGLLNLDHRNDGSCLCDGKNPTVACNEPCRDLCREFGKYPKCGKCYWGCNYDVNTGRAVGLVFKSDRSGLPCCTEMAYGCLKPLPLEKQCPDREKGCYDCSYVCKKCFPYHFKFCPNPGVGKIELDAAENMPCCKGTPRPYGRDFCKSDPQIPDGPKPLS